MSPPCQCRTADHDGPRMQLAVVVTFVLGGRFREPESVYRAEQSSTALVPLVWRAFLCGVVRRRIVHDSMQNTTLCLYYGFGERREVGPSEETLTD